MSVSYVSFSVFSFILVLVYAEDRLPLNISIPPSQFIELVTIEGENMNCDHTDWANIWARVHAGELK